MQQEAWRSYLQLALGVTEASRQRATRAARDLLGRSGATAEQLQALAEDIVKTGMANREALTTLVRYELDRTLGRVGLATAEQVDELTARVRDLERQIGEARTGQEPRSGTAVPTAGLATPGTTVAKKATKKVAKKAVKKPGEALPGTAGATGPSAPASAAGTGEVAKAVPSRGAAKATPEVARAAKASAAKAPAKKAAKAAKAAKAGAAPAAGTTPPDAPAPRVKAANAARKARDEGTGVPDPSHPTAPGDPA